MRRATTFGADIIAVFLTSEEVNLLKPGEYSVFIASRTHPDLLHFVPHDLHLLRGGFWLTNWVQVYTVFQFCQ